MTTTTDGSLDDAALADVLWIAHGVASHPATASEKKLGDAMIALVPEVRRLRDENTEMALRCANDTTTYRLVLARIADLESDLATARAELARVREERDGLRESDRHLRIVGDARRYCAAHARAQRDAGNHEAFNAMTLTRMRFTEELRQVGSISLARFIIAGADAAAPPRGDAE